MTKSVFGSFIVQFDINSDHGKEVNKDVPTYDEKKLWFYKRSVIRMMR